MQASKLTRAHNTDTYHGHKHRNLQQDVRRAGFQRHSSSSRKAKGRVHTIKCPLMGVALLDKTKTIGSRATQEGVEQQVGTWPRKKTLHPLRWKQPTRVVTLAFHSIQDIAEVWWVAQTLLRRSKHEKALHENRSSMCRAHIYTHAACMNTPILGITPQ